MTVSAGDRYEARRALAERGARRTWLAHDRLSGRTVVLKTDEAFRCWRELRHLLALPPAVGPRVLDAAWTAGGQLWFAQEALVGRTLREAAAEADCGARAALWRDACEVLQRLHRAGFVHGDLKPANIFVLARAEQGGRVRFLDYGCATARAGDPVNRLPGEAETGGTPPFVAPEVARGWSVDGRADQFSLAVTFLTLFPELERDPAWGPVLRRASDPLPARRYEHAGAMRATLDGALGAVSAPGGEPLFGGGPLRGRDGALKTLGERVAGRRAPRVLVRARPGLGLSRFLLEAVAELAARGGPPVRMLDLPSLGPAADTARILAWMEAARDSGGAVLAGIDDSSPGLTWSAKRWEERLRRQWAGGSWERLALEPLGAAVVSEIAADSLGAGGEAVDQWAVVAAERADGDLHAVAADFAALVAARARLEGNVWKIDEARAPAADVRTIAGAWPRALSGRARGPGLEVAPEGWRAALAACARAGRVASRELIDSLLARLDLGVSVEGLLREGLLEPAGAGRVRFVSRRLWEEAGAAPAPGESELEAWLNRHQEPEPDRIEEVLIACGRARRLGERGRESRLLGEALAAAQSAQAWGDVRRLCAYPGAELSAGLSAEEVLERAEALAGLLGPGWGGDRVLLALGAALRPVDLALGTALLRRVAEDERSEHSVAALLLLADHARGPGDTSEFEHLAALLRARAQAGRPVPGGVMESFLGHLAWRAGRPAEAEALAERAAAGLAGSGLVFESYTLQMLAILRFARDPAGAIGALEAACARAPDQEILAQITHNLGLMYLRVGRHQDAIERIGRACERLGARVRPSSLAALRLQRAWAWADLDRIDQAWREAHDLLSLACVRQVRGHHVAARLLIGFCHLHRDSSPRALAEAAWAWEEVRGARYVALRTGTLRALLDTLLDLGAWEFARERASELELGGESAQALDVTCAARARALVAQAHGRTDEAAAALAGAAAAARGLTEREAAARYLGHFGLVQLALDQPGPAAASLSESLRALDGAPGRGYLRARTLLDLAEARRRLGDQRGAAALLDDGVALARRIRSRGVLARALQARARWMAQRR